MNRRSTPRVMIPTARLTRPKLLIPRWRMAVASPYTIAAQNAESFSERVISGGNLIMDEGNTALDDAELEMMVVLRLNRKFMKFMRLKYPHVTHETFKSGTALRDADNETDSDEEGDEGHDAG